MDLVFGLAFLAVMAAILLPYFARSRGYSCRINCTNNLKQIGLSYKQWSLDNQDRMPMQVSVTNGGTMELVAGGQAWVHFRVMSNELNTPRVLFCPEEKGKGKISATTFGGLTAGTIPLTNDNNVSYFVGVEAMDSFPTMWLSGDENLAISGKPVTPGLLQLWTNAPLAWDHPRHEKRKQGCIGFADGSIQSAASLQLHALLTATGVATNRLAMP